MLFCLRSKGTKYGGGGGGGGRKRTDGNRLQVLDAEKLKVWSNSPVT